MPPQPETAPGFWRCGRCGTPNPTASYLTRCLGCGRPIPPGGDAGAPRPTVVRVTRPARQGPIGRLARARNALLGRIAEARRARESRDRNRRAPAGPWWHRAEAAAWGYAALILLAIGAMRGLGLSWWLVPTLLFLPRGLALIPVALLAIGTGWARSGRAAAVVALDALLVVGPLMGLSVPFRMPWSSEPLGPRVRILSYNTGGPKFEPGRFVRYLDRERVDVVCFQEYRGNPEVDRYLAVHGWHVDSRRRIASRFPIVAEYPPPPDSNKSDERFTMLLDRIRVRHPEGPEFVVASVHLPTPRRGYQRLREKDFDGLRRHLEWWDEEASRLSGALGETDGLPILIGGDFNMPIESARMARIRSAYPSAFDESGWGYGFTRPSDLPWVRIDHILGSRDWTFGRSWVGPDLGSDHLPIVAEAVLGGPPGG